MKTITRKKHWPTRHKWRTVDPFGVEELWPKKPAADHNVEWWCGGGTVCIVGEVDPPAKWWDTLRRIVPPKRKAKP